MIDPKKISDAEIQAVAFFVHGSVCFLSLSPMLLTNKQVKVRLEGKSYAWKGSVMGPSGKKHKNKVRVVIEGKEYNVSPENVWLMKLKKTYKGGKGEVVPSPRYSGDARSDPEARRHNGDYLALTPQPPQVVRTATFNRMNFTNTFITCAKGSVVYARGRKTEKAATQNAANEHMMGGGGLDGAISGRGGEGLHRARSRLPFVAPNVRCETGDAVITPSGDFKNQKVGHIIHAVGPNFHLLMDNNHGMILLLKATLATMRIAKEADIQELFMGIVSGGIFRASVPLKTIVQIILMAVISSTYVGLKEVMITGFSDEEVTCIQETIREFSTPNGFKNFMDTMSTDFIEAIYRPL